MKSRPRTVSIPRKETHRYIRSHLLIEPAKTQDRNRRHTHERIRGNNRLTHKGQWRNSRNVIMVHEARKVVTAIMGNCTRRMVPQWRISLPLTTDCPNTSCSPRQHNERPLSGSGSLYTTDVLFISIAWTMVLSSISLPPLSLRYVSPRFYFPLRSPSRDSSLFFLSLALSLSLSLSVFLSTLLPYPRAAVFLFRASNEQPLDKPSDLYRGLC